jgi:Transglycosylase SLT domain
MLIKVIISAALVGVLWWFVGRQDQGLRATADKVKTLPSTISLTPNASSTVTANGLPAATYSAPPASQTQTNPTIAAIPTVSASPTASAIVLKPRPLPIDRVTEQILNGLMSAIISQESGGNPNLQHPISKAIGLGQVLPSNIPTWTQEAFGQELTVEQFKNSPDVQFYTIRYKLYEYYRKSLAASSGDLYFTVRRVSAQWYSGQAELYESTKPVATGPTIRDYTLEVLSRFRNFYPQNYIVSYR